MADKGVIYTYLNHPAGSLPIDTSAPAQHHTCPQCPLWHRVSCAGNFVLLGAVIVLVVLVCQRPSQNRHTAAVPQTAQKSDSCEINRNTTVYNCTLEDFRSYLKQNLCEVENSSAEGSECKLCPRHWVPHRDKCYWLSEENQYWSRGRDDCSRRGSQLLVIQDQEELEFIQNTTRNQNPMWIGLNITSPGRKWTWMDGSPLNQTRFTVLGSAEENSCAAVKKNQIQSELCTTVYKWICQKEAVLI
ncbi:killer cell lectin-like receptor subfamily B member 1B allele C [Dermochelys coriacea]|uniref:killer cell lectin-like receptor subfamily B member 1B allele C n=1 Tax=Dermochelys coriacea TaxID=27794 RepID=UPI0018E7CF18|nr:killer cell lectin-like receptor subfamily B member 1B allele C [Dermochelys coriacea]